MKARLDFETRSSGLLMHPTSLPGNSGSGDIGPAAHEFVRFLARSKQRWWQMLPVGPAGDPPGNSPYSSWSSAGGSPLLVSLELLANDGLLTSDEARFASGPASRDSLVDYEGVTAFRLNRLRKAFARFKDKSNSLTRAFAKFSRTHRDWLDDFALFISIKNACGGVAWTEWPRGLRDREPDAIASFVEHNHDELEFHKFVQWSFDRQWTQLRSLANSLGVGLIGDVPIFVAHDSVDVWKNRALFKLDRLGRPTIVSGYPPDSMSPKGQRWGHPHYHWTNHRANKFAWWVDRFRETFRLFDAVRIDHFLGFQRTWAIPAKSPTAADGKWTPSPGYELFNAVRDALGRVPIIAEDLGLLTPAAAKLRDEFDFPGMRILQFGFGGGNYHLPHEYQRRCVVYTGTHDNETIVGWFDRVSVEAKKRNPDSRAQFDKAKKYLHLNGSATYPEFQRALMASVANTVILPVQDLLGLDASHRMNVPGTSRGNWRWRLAAKSLTPSVADALREITELYDRA